MLHLPPKAREHLTLWEQFVKLDPIGTTLFLPSTVCLLLALQWGGTTYAWSSWRIILLLVLSAILFISFLAIQIYMPNTATLPTRILTHRTIASSFLFALTSQAAMILITYYIPLFFQALKSFSPTQSGYATIPFILSLVLGTIFAGALVQAIGYPAPFMLLSAVIFSLGIGLLTTWPVNVHPSVWIGYQVLAGFGVGIGMQQPGLNAQIVLSQEDNPTGVSLMMFAQNFGGAVFLSVGQNVFTDELARGLGGVEGLRVGREEVVRMGAISIRKLVPEEAMGVFLECYSGAVRGAMYVALGLACCSAVGALLVEWKSVKAGKEDQGADGSVVGEKKEDV